MLSRLCQHYGSPRPGAADAPVSPRDLAISLIPAGGARLTFAQAPALLRRGRPCPRRPEDVGVSSERLERLDQTVQQYVDEGKVAGVVTLVARKGQVVQFGAYGKRDIESGSPMAKDSIFRIASMSKAITSVAIMMLMEEGKLTHRRPRLQVHPAVQEHDGRRGISRRHVVTRPWSWRFRQSARSPFAIC